jgi:hypothetical protein
MSAASRFPLLPLLVMLALSGCAAPRYETTTQREAPTGAAAQACLEACAARLETCKQACAETYQACLKRVEPEAGEHYRQVLDRYAADLERYRSDLYDYQFQLWVGWYGDNGGIWYNPWHHPWFGPWSSRSYVPPPPAVPTRDAVLADFRESRCGGDCGCQPPYDACFLACGGKISSVTRCVDNCPDKP